MANLRRALLFTIPRILNSSNRPLAGTFSSFLTSNEASFPNYIDLSNEESKRRLFNRLIYRSKQRGYLELDLVLGKWVEEHIQSMDENGIKFLVHVLDQENPDLWKWLTGQEQPPDAISTNPVFSAVREKVINNLDKHASPETRLFLENLGLEDGMISREVEMRVLLEISRSFYCWEASKNI